MSEAKNLARAEALSSLNQFTAESVPATFGGLQTLLKSLLKTDGWLDQMEQMLRSTAKKSVADELEDVKEFTLNLLNELVRRQAKSIYTLIRRMGEKGLSVQNLPPIPLARRYSVDQARDLFGNILTQLELVTLKTTKKRTPKKRGPKEHPKVLEKIKLFTDWQTSGLSKRVFLDARGYLKPKDINIIEAGRKAYDRKHPKSGRNKPVN